MSVEIEDLMTVVGDLQKEGAKPTHAEVVLKKGDVYIRVSKNVPDNIRNIGFRHEDNNDRR